MTQFCHTVAPKEVKLRTKLQSPEEGPGEGGESHPVGGIHFGTDSVHGRSLLQPLLLLLLCFARLPLQQGKAKLAAGAVAKTCLSLCGTEGSVSTGLASAARTSSPSCCTLAGVGKIQARSSRETLGVSPTAQLPCQEEYRPLGQLGHCEDPVRLRDDACSRAQPEWVPNKYSPPHPPLRREQLILDTISASFREEMASEVAADSCS